MVYIFLNEDYYVMPLSCKMNMIVDNHIYLFENVPSIKKNL